MFSFGRWKRSFIYHSLSVFSVWVNCPYQRHISLKSARRTFFLTEHFLFFIFFPILTENKSGQAGMSSMSTQSFSASYNVKQEFHTNTLLLPHSCPSYLPVMVYHVAASDDIWHIHVVLAHNKARRERGSELAPHEGCLFGFVLSADDDHIPLIVFSCGSPSTARPCAPCVTYHH